MFGSVASIFLSKVISAIELIFGLFIIVFFGIRIIVKYFVNGVGLEGIAIEIAFAAIGLIFLFFSLKRKFKNRKYKSYYSALSSDTTGLISAVASAVGYSQKTAERDISNMIKKNYLPNTKLDSENHSFVCESKNLVSDSDSIEYVAVTCKNCGGTSKVQRDKVGVCDYCGCPLEGVKKY